MRIHRIIPALFTLAVLPAFATGEATPKEITVFSFNIRNGGRRMDGVYDRPLQRRVIAAHKPDFLAMQEVDRKTSRVKGVDVPAEFGEALGMKFHYAPAMKYAGGEYGTAAFSRFPIVSADSVPMPFKGVEPRAAAVLTVRLPEDGELTFVSVHLDSGDQGDARVANMKALLARIEKVTTPVIVAGDFNDGADSEAIAMLRKAGFRRSEPKGSPLTFPADKPVKCIDHILLRDGVTLRLEDAGTEVPDEPNASDHRPLLSRIRLVPKAS